MCMHIVSKSHSGKCYSSSELDTIQNNPGTINFKKDNTFNLFFTFVSFLFYNTSPNTEIVAVRKTCLNNTDSFMYIILGQYCNS